MRFTVLYLTSLLLVIAHCVVLSLPREEVLFDGHASLHDAPELATYLSAMSAKLEDESQLARKQSLLLHSKAIEANQMANDIVAATIAAEEEGDSTRLNVKRMRSYSDDPVGQVYQSPEQEKMPEWLGLRLANSRSRYVNPNVLEHQRLRFLQRLLRNIRDEGEEHREPLVDHLVKHPVHYSPLVDSDQLRDLSGIADLRGFVQRPPEDVEDGNEARGSLMNLEEP